MQSHRRRLHQGERLLGGGGGARTEPPDPHPGRGPDPKVAALGAKLLLTLPERVIADRRQRFGQRLVVVAGVVREPEIVGMGELAEVLAPDFNWIHTDLTRQEVDAALDGMRRFGPAGPAVSVGWSRVGQNPDGLEFHILDVIGTFSDTL